MYQIMTKERLNPTVSRMVIEAPFVARKAQVGQFIILRAGEQSKRIPLTVADVDREKGTVSIIYQVVGAGTMELDSLQPGQSLHDFVGPLGTASELEGFKKVCVVGGGVGCAIAYPSAKKLHQLGTEVHSIIGFRTQDLVILEDQFREVSSITRVMTDDGTYGEKGLVTQALEELILAGHQYDQVIAIGPLPMMKFVCQVTAKYGVKTIVSMNSIMVDGTGMCGGCRLTVGGETKFACVDGPEFDGHLINFDEAISRSRMYLGFEEHAREDACRLFEKEVKMGQRTPRVPIPARDPVLRAQDFEEVSLGYNRQMAVDEARRCLQCKHKPCVSGCPVGIDIPAFIKQLALDDPDGAYEVLARDTALPAVCGRVCPQESQCEGRCVVGIKGQPVAIGALERYAADVHMARDEEAPVCGLPVGSRKVAVVGAGPSGLTAAGELAKRGYAVTLFEALHEPGGVLTYGIPEFRLPKQIVRREVSGLEKLGVRIDCNMVIGKTLTVDELFDQGYEALYIASGAGLPRFMGIPGESLNGVLSANEYLTRINLMKAYRPGAATPIFKGQHVAVVGGGNVAMDAARSARRMGAKEVTIIYRRGMEELPARKEEVHHAIEEGIQFRTLCAPTEVLGEKGWVKGVRCIQMDLGEPDASGRRRPVEKPDSAFEMEIDTLIMAIGTDPNPMLTRSTPGLETNRRGCIIADEVGLTQRPLVWAGGDAVTGAATVILAMGAGKTAAQAIDAALTGNAAPVAQAN